MSHTLRVPSIEALSSHRPSELTWRDVTRSLYDRKCGEGWGVDHADEKVWGTHFDDSPYKQASFIQPPFTPFPPTCVP